MKRRILIAIAFLCGAVPAMAQPPSRTPAGPPCLRSINLYDFQSVPGNRSLIVTDRLRQKYLVRFMGICPGLQFHLGLRFKSFGSDLSCMARGDSVIAHDVTSPGRCIIQSIDYYTPGMEQDDRHNKDRH